MSSAANKVQPRDVAQCLRRYTTTITPSSSIFGGWLRNPQTKADEARFQTHVHFGRFGAIRVTVMVAGEHQTFEVLTESARDESATVAHWIADETGICKKLVEVKISLTVFRNGHGVNFEPVSNINDLQNII